MAFADRIRPFLHFPFFVIIRYLSWGDRFRSADQRRPHFLGRVHARVPDECIGRLLHEA